VAANVYSELGSVAGAAGAFAYRHLRLLVVDSAPLCFAPTAKQNIARASPVAPIATRIWSTRCQQNHPSRQTHVVVSSPARTGNSASFGKVTPDAEIRNDSYLEPWYPEDATAEIWSQDGEDISDSIAMAMKENLIHCRLDREDGVCRAFVLPEDELPSTGNRPRNRARRPAEVASL
jgi:hypothetical protein